MCRFIMQIHIKGLVSVLHIYTSFTDLDQRGGDVRVGDPAGDDQRLLLLQVQHIGALTRMVHKWLLAV